MPSLLCLDLGTSAAKAALIDLDGTVGAQDSSRYPTRTTADGGAEQDPRDWLRAARTAITGVLRGRGETPLALSITGQMQDLVLLADGEPGPAILYSDTRAADEADQLREILRRDGLGWDELVGTEQDATSCAAMLLRLARVDADRVRAARGVVFGPAGYLVHELGLGTWCDVTTASTTGLFAQRAGDWSAPVARAVGLAREMLPDLVTGTGQIVGRTGDKAAGLLGLPAGVPVVLAPGDAGATTLGIVGLEPGDDYVYLGTSGWLAAVVPGTGADGSTRGAGTSHHLALGVGAGVGVGARDDADDGAGADADAGADTRAGAGTAAPTLRISALLAAGAAADWARQAFLGGVTPEDADRQLEHREAEHDRGPTGLLALPSIQGERYPVRDADLRAAVIGMGAQTRGIDLYAAVLEGVAHAIAHAAEENRDPQAAARAGENCDPEAAARVGEPSRPLAVVGGGTASRPWMRILADVTGRPVRPVREADAALVGCALAAVQALGIDHRLRPLVERADSGAVQGDPSADVDSDPGASDVGAAEPVIEPDPSAVRAHAALRRPHRALYSAVIGLRAAL